MVREVEHEVRGGRDGRLADPLAQRVDLEGQRRAVHGHRFKPVAPAEGVGDSEAAVAGAVVGRHVARRRPREVARGAAVSDGARYVFAGVVVRRLRRRAVIPRGAVGVHERSPIRAMHS